MNLYICVGIRDPLLCEIHAYHHMKHNRMKSNISTRSAVLIYRRKPRNKRSCAVMYILRQKWHNDSTIRTIVKSTVLRIYHSQYVSTMCLTFTFYLLYICISIKILCRLYKISVARATALEERRCPIKITGAGIHR